MGRNMFWGAAFLIVGLLLLASNAGYIAPINFWGLWPVLIIVPALKFVFEGAYITVGSHAHGRIRIGHGIGIRVIAFWVLAGATAQLLHNVGLSPYTWGDVSRWTLPILLVGFGLAILTRPKRGGWDWTGLGPMGPEFVASGRGWSRKKRSRGAGEQFRPDRPEEAPGDGSRVSNFVGDLRFGARPWEFKSPMELKLWAGDIDMDLTTARFQAGDNFLLVKSWAGDLDIRAPRDLEVFAQARCAGGHVRLFDQHREGMSVEVRAHRKAGTRESENWIGDDGIDHGKSDGEGNGDSADTAENGAGAVSSGTRLFITIEMNFGNITVR